MSRRWLWVAVGVVVVIALAALAWFTPLLSVRTVEVRGLASVPEDQVLAALDLPQGQPLLQVDTGAAAQRVAQIPKVAQARVQREYPSTVRVTVDEREPAVFYDSPQGTHLMDSGAVDFAIEPPPPGVPRLTVSSPGPDDPVTLAALDVLSTIPPGLRTQVSDVAARSISDIRLTLLDKRVIVWGSADNADRKAAIALPLLTQPGQTYDISSPDLPTVK
ncbi:FtsQ-type POTRA domain-containing protein [Aldersonia sp. NBC_00410]|jgi:cell division protein FtsQ|uniref:cell division protein FtsQ/DivIB n=1 Tax=Aldersonia sp. NBC_00410 TaxID=2975954 RepID=UPI00225403A3|nr:FtsQ-type POTRA domain-containing protein [Aldersonia sp. NBC_00410]MCX5045987.1 FtsQ-type POTRA domain-containing protein [Aldersonia sp. NBC_00410]